MPATRPPVVDAAGCDGLSRWAAMGSDGMGSTVQ